MRKLFVTFSLGLLSLSAQSPQSTVPEALREPAEWKLVMQAHGVGDQVYSCKAVEAKYAWSLKGPDAKLLGPDGQLLGRHFAGPAWEANDGSRVVGKALASVPSPRSDAVPWLRIEAIRHQGNGIMNQVIALQRLNTKGGAAPATGCDASHVGADVRVPYEADYLLYSAAR